MRVLGVMPDGNALDRIRTYSQWNNELDWNIITIRPDADLEPDYWMDHLVHLNVDDRYLAGSPPAPLPDMPYCQYAQACHALRDPFLRVWPEYRPEAIAEGIDRLKSHLMAMLPADMIVTWGERGWYNEVALEFAKALGIPACRLERATFPGMLVADGTGLEQGRCDLAALHNPADWECFPYEQLETWLSMAVWQSVEAQERTTAGMVSRFLDERPTVFVPLQVPFDTNLVFRSSGFNNYDLLEYVAEHYSRNRVLVKQHPGDHYSDTGNIAAYCADHGWELLQYNSHALIEASDLVVSINSQCLVEAWMHARPTVTLGAPAFDLPEETDKEALLYTLRFAYYIEPWQLTQRLEWIRQRQSN